MLTLAAVASSSRVAVATTTKLLGLENCDASAQGANKPQPIRNAALDGGNSRPSGWVGRKCEGL